eukprot:Skav200930  [mRNA]  locus=scaffold2433:224942:231297:+ [translate_table: standard]
MSQNATDTARDVSSYLVPHQSSEDLVAQGVPAREARRRAFRRTLVMEYLRIVIEIFFYWSILMPILVSLILLLVLFWAHVVDAVSGKDWASDVNGALFGHVTDHCR